MIRKVIFPVVILKTKNSFNAFSPLMPTCVAIDKTVEKVTVRLQQAIEGHLKQDASAKNRILKSRHKPNLTRLAREYGHKGIYTFIKIKIKG